MKELFEKLQQTMLGVALAVMFPITAYYGIQLINPHPEHKTELKEKIKSLEKERREYNHTLDSLESAAQTSREQVTVQLVSEQGIVSWRADKKMEQDPTTDQRRQLKNQISEIELQLSTLHEESHEHHKKVFRPLIEAYNHWYFYLSLLIGFIALLCGLFTPIASVGFGLMLGSVIKIVIGYIRVARHLSTLVKFLSLLGVTVLIIVVGSFSFKKMLKLYMKGKR